MYCFLFHPKPRIMTDDMPPVAYLALLLAKIQRQKDSFSSVQTMADDDVPLADWRIDIGGYTCYAAFNRYMDPFNIAINLKIVDTHEDYARVTINDGKARPDDRVLVKDYSENEGLPEILQEAGLIGKLIRDGPYAEYELLLKPANLVSKEDAKKYKKQ